MHEQKHSENNVPRPQNESRDPVEANAREMRKFALENPCFTTEEHREALAGGKFSKSFTHGRTAFVHVVLTVSPFDEKEAFLVWHCSMSIRSNSTGRAKSYGCGLKTKESAFAV